MIHDRIALMTKLHGLAGHIVPLDQSTSAKKLLYDQYLLLQDLAILLFVLYRTLLKLINANLLLLILCQPGLE